MEKFFTSGGVLYEGTLGSQGVQVLLKRMKEKEEKTKKAEEDGKSTENGETLKNYDSERIMPLIRVRKQKRMQKRKKPKKMMEIMEQILKVEMQKMNFQTENLMMRRIRFQP